MTVFYADITLINATLSVMMIVLGITNWTLPAVMLLPTPNPSPFPGVQELTPQNHLPS